MKPPDSTHRLSDRPLDGQVSALALTVGDLVGLVQMMGAAHPGVGEVLEKYRERMQVRAMVNEVMTNGD